MASQLSESPIAEQLWPWRGVVRKWEVDAGVTAAGHLTALRRRRNRRCDVTSLVDLASPLTTIPNEPRLSVAAVTRSATSTRLCDGLPISVSGEVITTGAAGTGKTSRNTHPSAPSSSSEVNVPAPTLWVCFLLQRDDSTWSDLDVATAMWQLLSSSISPVDLQRTLSEYVRRRLDAASATPPSASTDRRHSSISFSICVSFLSMPGCAIQSFQLRHCYVIIIDHWRHHCPITWSIQSFQLGQSSIWWCTLLNDVGADNE